MNTTVILINYNGEKDTIDCVGSLNKYLHNINIIIIDNKSSDYSVSTLKNSFSTQYGNSSEDVYKNLSFTRYRHESNSIYLIESDKNLGFAGGNNIGIRYAIENNLSTYIWILNNDTYIKKDSLTPLIDKFRSDRDIAFVGSTLVYSFDEETVQCSGGAKYYSFIGKAKLINKRKKIADITEYNGRIDFLNGASMLTSVDVVNGIGLFTEDYFMYSEEHDWQIRAQKLKKKIVYASGSIVYHKEAASSGKSSKFYSFYMNRSAMLLSLRFYPYFSIFSFLFLTLQAMLKTRPLRSFGYAVRGLISGILYYFKKGYTVRVK